MSTRQARRHAGTLPAHRQRGLSMIELMVALGISMFLLAGLVAVFATSNRTYLELNRAGQQIENGRFAVQILADDIAMAGFYGRYYSAASLTTPGALPDPCETATMATLLTGVALPVQGYNAPASSPITACVPTVNHLAGTDILVVRRADSTTTAVGALQAQEVYIQANADPSMAPIVALGTAANFTLKDRDGTTTAPIRKYRVHVYFVAPCSIPNGGGTVCTGAADDNGSPIPTLKRLELMVDPSDNTRKMLVRPLVEGIENFQLDYGVDADGNGVQDVPTLAAAPATVDDWRNVVTIRVNVLARNLLATPGYTDAKTYDMGVAGTVTPGGGFKRHVYNSVLRVVNPSSRKESS